MCECEDVRKCIRAAEVCNFPYSKTSHAASETVLNPPTLPCTDFGGMMGAMRGQSSKCESGNDELVATLLATCYSLRSADCLVHIVDSENHDAELILSVSVSVLELCPVLVLSVRDMKDGKQEMIVRTSSNPAGFTCTESLALMSIRAFIAGGKPVLWYWSPDVLGYASIMSQSPDSSWVYTLPNDTKKGSLTYGICVEGGGYTKLMPFFYTRMEDPTVLLFNTGFNTKIYSDDLKVDAVALSRPVVSRVYMSRSSENRCFCCQYIWNVHSMIRGSEALQTKESVSLRLSRKFRQSIGREVKENETLRI